ncbi:hypothetical protein ELH43_36805 [Rhizobium ruizarguesonis]|uniref:hypothetical protein n=1 Tax=Rhizobium ruizarguesonis TaxID=2081791 RepID=UPI0010325826|nr:hypothetical protein [Rhizobium ruizarguesonis]TBB60700.1 hypothetical protein ELH43_36805 [Rhizobium ruizarguesonis]
MRGASFIKSLTFAFLIYGLLGCFLARASEIETLISGDQVVLSPAGQSALRQWVEGPDVAPPAIKQAVQVSDVIATINACDVTLDGWNKKTFIEEWSDAEADLTQRLKRLVSDGKALKVGPPITWRLAGMLAAQPGAKTLPLKTKALLEKLRDHGAEVTVFWVEGIPGPWVTDKSVDPFKSVPSADQIAAAAEHFLQLSLADIYGRLALTPSGCYSAKMLPDVKSLINLAYPQEKLIAKMFGDENLVQIECGKVGTHSRFRIPTKYLSEPVQKALASGPWPFGPAGNYFGRDWFYVHAAWQMYQRERKEYFDNLSADVADYTCGPP